MIVGIIHKGSGLGDQLFSYITTRTTAERLGVEFGFVGSEFFKGNFIQLDWGANTGLEIDVEPLSGKVSVRSEHKLFESQGYDPEFFFIEDGTAIDGCCLQDERYWDIEKVRAWIKTEPLEMPDDLCVINFRGGEFATVPDLFLKQEYWEKAIWNLCTNYPSNKIKFEVHTDDVYTAGKLLIPSPKFLYYQNIALNWRSVRYAKHLILSNSAFGILPALLNENVKEVIAPRYWARRNTQTWSMPSNWYSKFTYI